MENILQSIIIKANNQKDIVLNITDKPNNDFNNLIKQLNYLKADYELLIDKYRERSTLQLYSYNDIEISYNNISEIMILVSEDNISNINVQIDNKLANLLELYQIAKMSYEKTDTDPILGILKALEIRESHYIPITISNLSMRLRYYDGESNLYIDLYYTEK